MKQFQPSRTHPSSFRSIPSGSFYSYPAMKDLPVLADLTLSQVLGFLLLHVPLLMIFRVAPILATAHSLFVLLLGIHYLIRDKDPRRVIWVMAYISGSEILWRGVEAAVVWEYAKYATLLLCILLILKYRLFTKGAAWPVLFVGMLLPGILVMPKFDREAISYELAGLVALAVLSFAFNALELRKSDIQRLFLAILAPTISMGFLVVFMLLTNDITFYARTENELITGNIGANQVSSQLSFGAMAAFYYIFLLGKEKRLRNWMLLFFIFLLTTSVLTFSRAGLWNALIPIVVSQFFISRDRKQLLRMQGALLAVGLLGYLIVYPILVNMTGGAVLTRFSSTNSTGRDRMAESDFRTFLRNPIWGVGVGQERYYREYFVDRFKNNHTEYTRLLAEHGIFGVLVILVLIGVLASRMLSRQPATWKGIAIAFTLWTLIYLAHSATRMVAPSLAFGLGSAHFLPEEEQAVEEKRAYPYRYRR